GNIYISDLDAGHVDKNGDPAYWLEYFNKQQHMGLPESDRFSYEKHPAYAGGNMTPCDLVIVTEGMRFDYGGYNFEAIDIRGHTPGQMGLYDKEASLLLCGDHILNKITPNINLWDFKADYLGLFLKNLKKVRALHVQTLLPAHRTPIPDANARIDELLAHHDRRLARILEILSSGKSSVYEVAMDLEWDYLGGYFGDFPTEQKWFAANEVFAHLEHLRTIGKVERKIEWPAYLYYVK
ncbi:MAG: MBL fold metallo-hydrolase, partial [Clostridiales bacterium]|nr:MBL fold metallo-hydrolase [Clostridiales bacterium]